MLGWILLGALLTGALLYFWNDIKEWLNSTAADAVERVLGYKARKAMHRAICRVDRIVNNLRTRATVFYKKNPLDTYYDKIELEATAPVYEFEEEVLDEIKKKGTLVQEFGYRG